MPHSNATIATSQSFPIARRSIISAFALLGLTACGVKGRRARTKLVLGDQLHLTQLKVEASGVLKGITYDFEWASFAGAAPLLEALAAGAVDTAPAGDLPVILAAAAGAPLKIIAASAGSPRDIGIIVPAQSQISRIADLVGRQVIVSTARGGISHYLLLEALKEAGVDKRDVKIGFMLPNDAAAAFNAGRIEAWATFGTYQFAAEQRGARLLRDGSGINSSLSLIAASDASLQDSAKRAAIKDAMIRQQQASDWVIANKHTYAKLYSDTTHIDPKLSFEVIARRSSRLVAPSPTLLAPLQHVVDRFYADGEMPAHIEVNKIVDLGILPA